jgi:site-specific recombinase XerD
MALTLYRRHRRECIAGHQHNSFSTEFEERKRGWTRCECPIVVSGTLQKKFKRHSTNLWQWDDARAIASQFETVGTWDGVAPVAAPVSAPIPDANAKPRTTIADATEAYLASRINRGVSGPTVKKYSTFIRQLIAYCTGKGYVMVDQLTMSDMDKFYATWKDAKRSKARKLERLKAFSKFCLKREWIAKDITDDLHAPEGAYVSADKNPFTDAEMDRIYAACDQLGGPTPPGPGHRPWGGEDVKDFVMLSVYTGLRISDVATFNIAKRLNGNNVFLRMHKTKKELYTWIPTWLVERLRAREQKFGPVIFKSSPTMRASAEKWRRQLIKVFELAGPWEDSPTPHRFRHTFVRILLEKGVPTADVATLIGDTEQVLLTFYAKWVPGRQDRLSKLLQDAFEDKPRPKLVSIR